MAPFWIIVLGIGVGWLVTSGRLSDVLSVLANPGEQWSGGPMTGGAGGGGSGGAFGVDDPPGVPSNTGYTGQTAPPQNVNGAAYRIDQSGTLTAAQIDRILGAYHSPAQGLGSTLVQYGQQYQIDPAVALAVFVHETTAGTAYGANRNTNQWGNIRCTEDWQGGCINGWRAYPSFAESARDWFRLMRETYVDRWGLNTVESFLPTYAPTFENDTAAYITQVRRLIRQWTGQGVQ